MKIVLATKNPGKIREIKAVCGAANLEFLTEDQIGPYPDVAETGATFYENALLKAKALADRFELPALADDSGLEVEALAGRPGVLSARYAGERAGDAANIAKLLDDLADKPHSGREARFTAVLVLAWPDGRLLRAEGGCSGSIGFEPRGANGFGYDPIFIPEGGDRTMAELSGAEKNKLSHRGRALRRLCRLLESAGPDDGPVEKDGEEHDR